ncbi:hypothetical protein Tcan_02108 [Toxocara canis]|uniref:Uncharacterized protein n=1 Tax=Toxocara canis TaxID=6265 RepID=A0A0B2UR28_TOXCA|nr:hypothetical protein Tcan_02108 [Toxocara canis]
MDRLRKEVLLLSGQLAEERSNNERAEATLVSHEREQLLCNVFAAEISNLAADECEVLRRKVEELESKLTEAANGAEVACKEEENAEALKRKVAELESQLAQSADRIERSAGFEKELNDLKTKLAELQLELQGECEAKEIVQDALKASEEMKNELAGQLVKVEEASAYEISQLRKQITELKQQLNGLWDEGNRAERQAANQEDTSSSEIQQNETLPEQLRCELDRLAAEKAKVVEENEQRKQLIEQLQKEHVELVDQLGQKERELSGYLEKEAHQKAALTKEIDLLREQLSDIVHRTAASVSEAIRVEFDRVGFHFSFFFEFLEKKVFIVLNIVNFAFNAVAL